MHQTASTSSAASLDRIGVPDQAVRDGGAALSAVHTDIRRPVLPYPMEEPDTDPEERRVPFMVSVSVLLAFSAVIWAGLIWLTKSLLG